MSLDKAVLHKKELLVFQVPVNDNVPFFYSEATGEQVFIKAREFKSKEEALDVLPIQSTR